MNRPWAKYLILHVLCFFFNRAALGQSSGICSNKTELLPDTTKSLIDDFFSLLTYSEDYQFDRLAYLTEWLNTLDCIDSTSITCNFNQPNCGTVGEITIWSHKRKYIVTVENSIPYHVLKIE